METDPDHSRPSPLLLAIIILVLLGETPIVTRSGLPGLVLAAQERDVSLEGSVRTDKGATITSGVTAILESDSGEKVVQQTANSDGYFQFGNLHKLIYHLTVTADGFQPAQQEVNLTYGTNRYFVRVLLTPADRTPKANQPLALTDEKAPKTARKEYERGAHALESRKLAEAQAHLEKAVAEYACYARAQTELGLVLGQENKFPRSEEALKKSIECDPSYAQAYAILGQLLNAEKRYQESETVLQRGERYSPGAWQLHYEVGIACYGQKNFAKAEAEYLRAQSLNSDLPPEFHARLADVYTKKGSYDKAYAEMQTYIRAEPNGRFASRIKDIMRQMQSSGVLKTEEAKKP